MVSQYFTGIPSTDPNSVTHCCVHRCNIHVTFAPEAIYGNVDYYKDPKKNVGGSGFKSRYYDFLERHQGCQHTIPDYYETYGNKYIKRFTTRLYPRLSEKGKQWLIKARRLLQKYMEKGFQQNLTDITIYIQSETSKNWLYLSNTPPDGLESLELDSANFRKFAFDTHPMAYVDGGFHEMSEEDMLLLIHEIDGWDLLSWETLRQMRDVIGDALLYHKVDYLKKTGEAISDVAHYLWDHI